MNPTQLLADLAHTVILLNHLAFLVPILMFTILGLNALWNQRKVK